MKSLIAGALVALFCCPAFAQEAACANTVDGLLAELAKPPVAEVADNVKVKAVHFDQIIIVNYHGHQFMWLALAGCVVAAPLDVGTLPDATPSVAPAPSALIYDGHA